MRLFMSKCLLESCLFFFFGCWLWSLDFCFLCWNTTTAQLNEGSSCHHCLFALLHHIPAQGYLMPLVWFLNLFLFVYFYICFYKHIIYSILLFLFKLFMRIGWIFYVLHTRLKNIIELCTENKWIIKTPQLLHYPMTRNLSSFWIIYSEDTIQTNWGSQHEQGNFLIEILTFI